MIDTIAANWGGDFQLELRAPSLVGDPHFRDAWARYLRMSASPGAAQTLLRMNGEIDVRAVLPTIRVPSLVLHRTGDRAVPVGMGRSLAAAIPGAKFIEIPGEDHLAWVGNSDPILDEIEEFLTGARHVVEPDRVLTTVMFTDIVDSTRRAAELGDRRWCELLDAHHALVREEIARFGAAKSTRRATVSSQPSTALPAPYAPRPPSRPASAASASRCAPVCTPARARSWAPNSAASRCTSAPVSRRSPRPARCSCPAP
jgi:TAP-like protein